MRRERGFGVNPWMTHSRFLVSHNLLIDPSYADPMRTWLGAMRPGSLLILDEAHHAAPSSGGRYGIESGGKVRGRKALEDVMVRRLKEDIRATQGGFPGRRVEGVLIDGLPPDAAELELSRLLDEYRSSVEAFARSLAVHRRTVERNWEQGQAETVTSEKPAPASGTGQPSGSEAVGTSNDEAHDLFLTPPAADDDRGEQEADLIEAEEEAQIEASPWPRSRDRRPIPVQCRRSCGSGSSSYSTGCRRSPTGLATSRTRRRAGSSMDWGGSCGGPGVSLRLGALS